MSSDQLPGTARKTILESESDRMYPPPLLFLPIAQVPAKVSCQVDLIFKLKSYVWVLGEGGVRKCRFFWRGGILYLERQETKDYENSSVQKIWGSHYAYNSLLGK